MNEKPQTARGKSLLASGGMLLKEKLWARILIGLGLGIVVGLILSPHGVGAVSWEKAYAIGEWLSLPGVIFLGLIQMVIIPLVVTSIVLGIAEAASLDFLKKMGLKVVLYFVFTTTIAITIGLLLVNVIEPGKYISQVTVDVTLASGAAESRIPDQTFDNLTVPKRIGNLIPTNLAQAQLNKDMLQIVIASILLGIALLTIPKKHEKPIHDLCVSIQVITMKIVSWALRLAPYAVFGLISDVTIRLGPDAFKSVAVYMATVLLGLICMVFVYGLIVMILGRYSPGKFFKGISEAQLLAFSTSSSAATMPFSIQAAEQNLGLRSDLSRFIIPLGATINMDGTAMYQAIAAVFLCQVFNIDLTMGETILLLLTTVGASIGTPAVPGVGIVVLATIISGIGVPAEGIALILGVDRILDMCRTTVNVTGDLTAATVLNRFAGAKTA